MKTQNDVIIPVNPLMDLQSRREPLIFHIKDPILGRSAFPWVDIDSSVQYITPL